MEWEYKLSSYRVFSDDVGHVMDKHISKWDDLGREGWELVSVLPFRKEGMESSFIRDHTIVTGYFKRVKPSDAEV